MAVLLDNRTGKESSAKTELFLHRRNNHLLCQFIAYNSSLNSYSEKDNDELYKGNVVEIFLDVNEKDSYLEIEVAPNGAKFVANIVNGKINFINNKFVKTTSLIEGNTYKVNLDINLSKYDFEKIKFNAFRIETKKIKQDYILEALFPTLSNTFHDRSKFKNLIDYLD